jgi:hypothetical protein
MIESHRNGIYASPSAGPGAAAEGIYARVANQVFHSVEAVEARAPAHEGVGPSILGPTLRRGRGQNRSIAAPAGIRPSITPAPIFGFPRKSSGGRMSRWKFPLVPREHETTRAIIRAKAGGRSFALSKSRFFGRPSPLATSPQTPADHTGGPRMIPRGT